MKIGLCGTHSSGKTTLMEAVRKEYPRFHYVTEAARDCPFPINENTGFKSQDFIFRTQVQRELNAPLDEITITDRTTYDQLAYVTYAYRKGNISFWDFLNLQNHLTHWGNTYKKIVYIPIEFELVNDGIRSPDEEYREKIDEMVKNILQTHVDPNKVEVITGTIPERRDKLIELIKDEAARKEM